MDRPALPPGPFLVAGLGRAGRAAADALRRAVGPERVVAWDSERTRATRAAARRLEAVGVRTRLGPAPPSREALRSFRTLVKSPGIAPDSAVVTRALDSGLDVIDELELGWRLSQAPTLAVTGTNGKSTVATLAAAVLEAAGMGGRLTGNAEFGTPLSAVAGDAAGWNVCEVSSFQLEASPGFLPDVAVFTNLTRDHLSRHRTMRSYGDAKRRMFVRDGAVVPCAVVDTDDRFGNGLADEIEAAGGRVVRVGSSAVADYRVVAAEWDLRRARVRLETPSGELMLETRLPGLYNARNAAAALAAVETVGVPRAAAARGVADQDGVPGRFEHIDEGQSFSAIVDFAHTPDALEHFLRAVRAGMQPGRRLMTVFGLGGPMDPVARRAVGSIARSLSDELILTTSGYRGHPRVSVLADILAGARAAVGPDPQVILDRRSAIERGLASAGPGDVVVIPSRGATPVFTVDARGGTIPFDDRTVTRELLKGPAAR